MGILKLLGVALLILILGLGGAIFLAVGIKSRDLPSIAGGITALAVLIIGFVWVLRRSGRARAIQRAEFKDKLAAGIRVGRLVRPILRKHPAQERLSHGITH